MCTDVYMHTGTCVIVTMVLSGQLVGLAVVSVMQAASHIQVHIPHKAVLTNVSSSTVFALQQGRQRDCSSQAWQCLAAAGLAPSIMHLSALHGLQLAEQSKTMPTPPAAPTGTRQRLYRQRLTWTISKGSKAAQPASFVCRAHLTLQRHLHMSLHSVKMHFTVRNLGP